MADRPILFSAPMVRALLREIEQPGSGKTQTRRVINFEGIENVFEFVPVATDNETGRRVYEMKDAAGQFFARPAGKHLSDYHFMPRYAPGGRLYVQEAWRVTRTLDHVAPRDLDRTTIPEWLATDPELYSGRKRPGMFLPRWASRITLVVSEVRVQRLLDINEVDASAEGVESGFGGGPAIEDFICLWNSIHGAFASDRNPWVAAYTFRPILGNIDQVKP